MDMQTFLVLLRGINVGGQNPVPMAALRAELEAMGYREVDTYIQSGNVVLSADQSAEAVSQAIEARLATRFPTHGDPIRVLALPAAALDRLIADRPSGFGDQKDTYHSDAIFLLGLSMDEALSAFSPREGVDSLWPGEGVIYHQRLSAMRTRTRLNRMMASPLYRSTTVRSWSTVLKLQQLLRSRKA